MLTMNLLYMFVFLLIAYFSLAEGIGRFVYTASSQLSYLAYINQHITVYSTIATTCIGIETIGRFFKYILRINNTTLVPHVG